VIHGPLASRDPRIWGEDRPEPVPDHVE